MSAAAHVGTLYDDLKEVALRIKSRCRISVQVVWVNATGDVFAAEFGVSPDDIAVEQVGVCSLVAPEDDIEFDLRVVLRSRMSRWLVN